MKPKTMFEKIWESHVVHEEPGKPSLIYIDRHLVHEVTSPQAFESLRKGCDERTVLSLSLQVEPAFDSLRSDRRFADLMRRIRLKP